MTLLVEPPRQIFVTGTDTGVGKTVLSLLLIHCAMDAGWNPAYIKPIQTGCKDPSDIDSDSLFVHRHTTQWAGADPADSVVYCFAPAKAPRFAAMDDGVQMDDNFLFEQIRQKSQGFRPAIIEGAGGVMVPITDTLWTVDLIRRLEATCILAARAGLGTINHTLLSLYRLKKENIRPAGVVLMEGSKKKTSEKMVAENIEAIEDESDVPVTGVLPFIDDFSRIDECHLSPVRRLLKLPQL